MRGPRCGWLRVKLVAPTSQAAALFYGRLFEIAPAVKPLLRGDMTEQGCKLMTTHRQSKYVLEHILRPSQLYSGGRAWIGFSQSGERS
jgi:hypothetical protein